MVTYDDYLKELVRIADNNKKEFSAKLESNIQQLQSELEKLKNEMKSKYVELSKLRQENDTLSETQEQYNRLVHFKNNASTLWEYQNLADKFSEIYYYKDSAKLKNECEEQYRALKERLEKEELEYKYNSLVHQLKNKASTESEFQKLAREFSALNNLNDYKDSVELSHECYKKYEALKERREEKERRDAWALAGLCQYCGGEFGGLFSKKCKSCGQKK